MEIFTQGWRPHQTQLFSLIFLWNRTFNISAALFRVRPRFRPQTWSSENNIIGWVASQYEMPGGGSHPSREKNWPIIGHPFLCNNTYEGNKWSIRREMCRVRFDARDYKLARKTVSGWVVYRHVGREIWWSNGGFMAYNKLRRQDSAE